MAIKRPIPIIIVVILTALIGLSASVDLIRFLWSLFQDTPSISWDASIKGNLFPLALNTLDMLFLIVAIGVLKRKQWAKKGYFKRTEALA